MKARVQAFQSLADVELDIAGLTVLVGRSNIGKSALIRALSGALFNRAGDGYFVRKGAKLVRVELTDVPVREGAPIHVVWEKGDGGVNRFEINGEKYSNVGRGAPAPLVEAGYRDLTLDQRESLRPQVGGQFQGPFLLDVPGSLVSEVLTRASRLDVLLRASAAAAKDLRSARQLLGVRRGDLTTAQVALDVVEPAVSALAGSVEVFAAQVTTAQQVFAHTQQLRALVGRRRRLQPAAGQGLGPRVETTAARAQADRVAPLRAAVRARQALLPVHGLTIRGLDPDKRAQYVAKAVVRVTTVASLRRALVARQRLTCMPALLPSTNVAEWVALSLRARALMAPVQALRGLVVVRDATLVEPIALPDFERVRRHALDLRALTPRRVSMLRALRMADAAVRELRQEEEVAHANTRALIHDLKVCPVCERPT